MQVGKRKLLATQTYNGRCGGPVNFDAAARSSSAAQGAGSTTRRPDHRKASHCGPARHRAGTALVLALVAFFGVIVLGAPTESRAQQFTSTRAAFEQGIEAYRSAYYEIAIPALRFAADKGSFVAKYYLGRIYADPQGAFTDHGKAYQLFYEIARDNLDVDPYVDRRAIVVAKALTQVASYVREGLPGIGLRADPRKAAGYLRQSAMQYGDMDAQFELAKLHLSGVGVRKDIKLARHFLSTLTQKGHASAQAFLADLLWRGKYVKRDRGKALALISMAMTNAPDHELLWIEDIYQNIYCGTSKGTRRQATGYVAVWKKQYGQIVPGRKQQHSAELGMPTAERTCANGEPVDPSLLFGPKKSELPGSATTAGAKQIDVEGRPVPADRSGADEEIIAPRPKRVLRGTMSGFTLRDIGTVAPSN